MRQPTEALRPQPLPPAHHWHYDPRVTTPRSVLSEAPEQTLGLGRLLGSRLRGGEVIALIGPLGAGKTHFVKGLAAGNAQTDPARVTSPTFILVNEYDGPRHLYHLDAFRLRDAADLDALGFPEMQSPQSVVVIEWADRVAEALPADRLSITFEAVADRARLLHLLSGGDQSERLLTDFLAAVG